MRHNFLLTLMVFITLSPLLQAETYVTEKNVSIDRCGTAWFITRFVDAGAEFRFFETGQTPPAGVTYAFFGSRYFNKGPDCTFAVMLKAHQKADVKALRQMNDQINDIFAWRSGPASLATRLREGIAELRKANGEDLLTYQRMFPVFDLLYLAYGGDPKVMIPVRQQEVKHLSLKILFELSEDPAVRQLVPELAASGFFNSDQKDTEKKLEALYFKLPFELPAMKPLGKDWALQNSRDGWKAENSALDLQWIQNQAASTSELRALKGLYILIHQEVLTGKK